MTLSPTNSNSSSNWRVAIVISHPIQYYAPWFKYLSQNSALELRIFYLNTQGIKPAEDKDFGKTFTWDTDLLSGYSHEFIPNLAKRPGSHHFLGLRNPTLRKAIYRFTPDAILLFGYNYWSHLGLILRPPAPLLFRGDSTLLRKNPPCGLKRLALRLVYSRFRGFLPVGKANTAYFQHFGVPPLKLFYCPHCVDIEHFSITSSRLAAAQSLRQSLGIPQESTVLLFAGKLIEVKRPKLLLNLFLKIASSVPSSHLIFSGDGELLPELRATASQHKECGNRVHFLSFANQSEMPVRYLLGDVLVLPSDSETWGLAVNEAMHLGRPAVVSDRVGCHPDLIIQGETGWIFRTDDKSHFEVTLREVLLLPRSRIIKKGQAAQAHAASFNYKNATAGLISALNSLS